MLLEGISNWINNCLIPISQLDLSAQTEEAVSYGKESEKRGEGESERSGKTQRDTGKDGEHEGQCSRNREGKVSSCSNRKTCDRWTRQMRRGQKYSRSIYVAIFGFKRTSAEWRPTRKAASLQGGL